METLNTGKGFFLPHSIPCLEGVPHKRVSIPWALPRVGSVEWSMKQGLNSVEITQEENSSHSQILLRNQPNIFVTPFSTEPVWSGLSSGDSKGATVVGF